MNQYKFDGDKIQGDKIGGDKVGRDKIVNQYTLSDKDFSLNLVIRQHLLEQLQVVWLRGILENSIHEIARLDLGLESRPDAIHRPWVMSLELPNQQPQKLPPTSKIIDTFRKLGGAMLILGEPGSGKTFTLLELARELRYAAIKDFHQPVPLVFNLSSWSQKRPPLFDWLIDELILIYGIGRKQAFKYLNSMPVHLLLDGLDEVAEEHRDACVTAINQLRKKHGPFNLAVCCRIEDFIAINNKLNLTGSVVIQPLTESQINSYLSTIGQHLVKLVREDEALHELAQVPLTLNIIAIAYRSQPPTEVTSGTIDERKRHLFKTYIERMFGRRQSANITEKNKSIHYLSWLASQMQKHDQAIFHIESMQPTWLSQQKGFNRLFTLIIYGVIGGSIYGLINGLIGGMIGGLLYGINGGQSSISISGIFTGIIGGLIGGLISGLNGGLLVGLIGSLTNKVVGNYSSVLTFSGEVSTKHIILRGFLALNGYIPIKLVPFLDEMADRIILRKVGGGYIFIHRMLLEYFADLEKNSQ